MKASVIKRLLLNKGITHLYHVNTVVTSLTYINNGGLLSRGDVVDLNLPQTPQSSDDTDKAFDIFYDIFFDSDDIHERAMRINYYGAVTFKYSVDVLDAFEDCDILITKDNPIRWEHSMSFDELYFTTETEICFGFSKGEFPKHITIKKPHRIVPFHFLEEIIIDEPYDISNEQYQIALSTLQNTLLEYGYSDIPLVTRECGSSCTCKDTYKNAKPGFTYYRFQTEL